MKPVLVKTGNENFIYSYSRPVKDKGIFQASGDNKIFQEYGLAINKNGAKSTLVEKQRV